MLSRTLLPALALAAGATSPLFAQSTATLPTGPLPSTLVPASGAAPQHHVYDVSTGALTTLAPGSPGGAVAATATCFDTIAFGPTSLTNPGQELVDWGIKSCGLSGVVTKVTVAYQSNALDPSVGGPGAEFALAVYEGTTGFGVLGDEVRRFEVAGFPAAPAPSPFPPIHVVTFDVSDDPILLPDGPLGWGFHNVDGQSAVALTLAPIPELGILDALDVYDGAAPTGTYTGTFNFGAGTPIASIGIEIEEDDGAVMAGSTVVNGSGVNPLAFTELEPASIGGTWITRVDLAAASPVNATVVVLTHGAIAPTPSPFGELLVDLSSPPLVTSIALGLHFVPVPLDLSLVGTALHAQATLVGQLVIPVHFTFTNGLDVTLGF